MLRAFGAHVARRPLGAGMETEGIGGVQFTVQGPLIAPDGEYRVEPDASSAAVALGAAAVTGGRVEIQGLGLGSAQPDARGIHKGLAALGCDVSASRIDRLVCEGRPTRGATIDCTDWPDASPVLAIVAARVARDRGLTSTLNGLGTLPGKESSRIEVLAQGLTAAGFAAEATATSLHIGPGPAHSSRPGRGEPLLLDPREDHRMAFAFALLALFEPRVLVQSPGCVAKSWPTFWRDLEALLVSSNVRDDIQPPPT